ncbi:YciI family protein [Demequina sp.]|uniref:YciI family protein n=1 Tax=Demequina sp. TaxID=2050685 RepID=UPI003D13C727
MPHYLLRYQYVVDIGERRGPFRDEHLSRFWQQADAGRVVLAGAAGEAGNEGIIVWSVDDPSEIHEFVTGDPYMTAGLVTSYDVVPWNTVVGDLAANPVRP